MTKSKRRTPKEVYREVSERSGGICELCHLAQAVCMAHLKHRKMGGTTDPQIHSKENIRHTCIACHDKWDGR